MRFLTLIVAQQPDLLPPPSGPLPLPSVPKRLIRWGIAGAVALVTLTGTVLLWMSSSGEVPVPAHLVSRLPPPTVPIVTVTPLRRRHRQHRRPRHHHYRRRRRI
jgi:hypothetical protein